MSMKIKLGDLKQIIREERARLNEEGGSMSPPMHLKGDPEMHLKRALRKHGYGDDEQMLNDLMNVWNYVAPNSWMALRRGYIDQTGLEDEAGVADEGVPSEEVFMDAYKALSRDQKRIDSRSSYEF